MSRTSTAAVPSDTANKPAQEPAAAASAGRLISSYGLLVASSMGGQVLGLIGLALVARRIGPHNLGAYGFAISLAAYFGLPFMAGTAMVGMRELASPGHSQRQTVTEVQGFLLINGAIALVALVALAPVLSTDSLTRVLLVLAGLPLIINAIGLDWAMQGMQRFRPLALYRFLGQAVYLIVLLSVLTGGREGTIQYAVCNVLGVAVTAIFTLIYVRRRLNLTVAKVLPSPRRVPGVLRQRMHRSLAPALSLMMIQIYYTLDFVLLGYLENSRAVGEYTTASRFPLAIAALGSLWVTVFYPHAAGLFHTDKERLRRQVGQFTSLSLLVAIPLIPFGFLMGHEIMAALFGEAYRSSGTAFAILLASAAVALLNSNVGQVLLACGDDRAFLFGVTLGTIVNVVLNVALIPVLGITGSALATLLAESAIIVAVTIRFWHTLGRIDLEWSRLARGAVALCGASILLLVLKPEAPWWGAILAAGSAYAILLIAMRAVTLAEVTRVLRPAV